ncbi:MAG: hypothetical protein KJ970_13215 [Candidatus Eisenbacteria bacterium]|uniref:Uncharacterized protein n=1 Tax=Eiseniibacteriota bacterium TaxID=2212470 RepID=A0A948RYE9_UNCEI|nr:hypothetical protein [Candidatus Eisenbacteria bacterium]MBU2691874.1 hypothetical protein [Candidatus Eisenbacteria bacterium]
MKRDLYSNLSPAESLAPALLAASANGTGVDIRGFDSALVVFHIGNWTDGTHTFSIEESDDDSTYTAVNSAYLQGTAPTVTSDANDDQIYKVGYVGDKRYIRAVQTITGSPSTGLVSGVTVLRGHPATAPVS